MPFQETYIVDFQNGNLKPQVNLYGWPDMRPSRPTPSDQAVRDPDQEGLTLRITRDSTVPNNTLANNSIYVDLTHARISLDSRLLLRVTFDCPRAEPLVEGDAPPDPWAVVLSVSPAPPTGQPFLVPGAGSSGSAHAAVPHGLVVHDFSSAYLVNVTCQFNDKKVPPGGVRLNTPPTRQGTFGALQSDQAAYLESPLNYGQYSGPGVDPLPLFCLEHSFCGWSARANGHTPGNGVLTITRGDDERKDQRAYSNQAVPSYLASLHHGIGAVATTVPPILGLGVSLVGLNGHGTMHVRLRRFSVLFNGNPVMTNAFPPVSH